MTGVFISFEGGDGSGKSTQARLLAESLRAAGRDVVLTREPGGSEGAEAIRDLVLNGAGARWSAVTETLLFTAARRDHLERVIAPAVDRGAVVLCDRFADSTRVYQAAGRGAGRDLVDRLHDLAIGREPDRTLIFDIDPQVALSRTEGRDVDMRFEGFGLDFQHALRTAYHDLARAAPGRCRMIDAAGAVEDVAQTVRAALSDIL